MDLDEMQERWAAIDRKLDASIRLNRRVLTATNLNRARSALHRLVAFLALESAIWILILLALGSFIYSQIAHPRFASPAAVLHLYAIGNLVAAIRQITAALQIDHDRPIAAIQKQLEAIRVLSIRTTQWALLGGILAWTPFVIVVLKGCFGVDAYRGLDAKWLLANLFFSLVVVGLSLWLSRKYGGRMSRHPTLERIMNELAGYNLNSAAGFLAAIAGLEDEDESAAS